MFLKGKSDGKQQLSRSAQLQWDILASASTAALTEGSVAGALEQAVISLRQVEQQNMSGFLSVRL